MIRTKWTERTFTFDFPEGWIFNILERLYGTAARLSEVTEGLQEEILTLQPGAKWSIKQHIGHLIDLEELHEGRLDDFAARKTTLRAADMTNAKTAGADHNNKPVAQLIEEFSIKRNQFIKRLEQVDLETSHFSSLHPRLQVMMRPVDVAFFTAEHDDHHLASIREIISSKNSSND